MSTLANGPLLSAGTSSLTLTRDMTGSAAKQASGRGARNRSFLDQSDTLGRPSIRMRAGRGTLRRVSPADGTPDQGWSDAG